MNIIEAIRDKRFFASWFEGESWDAWIVFLKALFALPMNETELNTFRRHTQRQNAPQSAYREAWLVVGRRGGKSLISAVCAVYLACFRDYSPYLKPGEVGTVAIIAADRRQARTILRYVRGFLDLPILKKLVANDTAESIELNNRVTIEVHTASFRSVRGYTLLAVICDEIAFWRSDESANPDSEIIGAVRPGLATIPNSLLLCISSPYSRRGALWNAYDRHFAKESNVLVWQASTRDMNPSIDPEVIEQAYEEDAASASAEYGAAFRRDLEAFISREAVDACRVPGRLELPPLPGVQYVAFTDPSGGSGGDSFTLAIAHNERERGILDCVREIKPPFSPEAAIEELSEVLKTYRVSQVYGDRWGGQFPRELFAKRGVGYLTSERVKSEIYLGALPLLNSGRVELLDNTRLISQLQNLERRTSRGGRDSIDHPPSSHDDLINAAAGALVLAAAGSAAVGFVDYAGGGNPRAPELQIGEFGGIGRMRF